ncbi:GTPase HflX [bacterium]|nr:GTPase HflX [bacterium]NBX49988.1 GTPase HflX [bacterium]
MFTHRAILADVIHFSVPKPEAVYRMSELEELTKTYGGIAVVQTIQRRAIPDYRTFLGKGKVEEIFTHAKTWGATVLIINAVLKPSQLFNLEEALRPVGVKVWDRIDLILHIFEKHAISAEAKLEIELARIRHMGPRIFNLGAQLGRQRGGTGTRGGSGEGNTEAMKRHLRDQEHRILDRLKQYESLRTEQRKHRVRRGQQTVALVGYTNAGKTSLLAALTKRKEKGENKLFATLDTRVGECFLPEKNTSVIISDTIGFIEGLPPELIKAFTSTLSEAIHADVILHVADGADPKYERKIAVVDEVLATLGAEETPRLLVVNKTDLLTKEQKDQVKARLEPHAFVSAVKKEGVEKLKEEIGSVLSPV